MDDQERRAAYERWGSRLNRRVGEADYRDEWSWQQCGGCRHWLALGGEIGDDWGVCSAASSAFDGIVRFEHDGCAEFSEDPQGFGVTRG